MDVLRQSLGIDVSKDKISITLLSLMEDFSIQACGCAEFSNNPSGHSSLLKWMDGKCRQIKEVTCIMEYTGVYHEHLAHFLYNNDLSVHLLLAHQAKKYAQSLNVKIKTDRADSLFLGRLGLERKLKKWQPSGALYTTLRTLSREKEDLQKEITIAKNQLHAQKHAVNTYKRTQTRLKNRIKYLEKQVVSVESDMKKVVSQDEELDSKVSKITSIPGVGFNTAVSIIGETNGFALIRNIKQLTSYAGLDIRIQESGKWKGSTRISKKGNSHIRRALYMPSLSVIQYSAVHKEFYHRLKLKKEKAKIALTAVQRKLLALIYTLWNKDMAYIANYEATK